MATAAIINSLHWLYSKFVHSFVVQSKIFLASDASSKVIFLGKKFYSVK